MKLFKQTHSTANKSFLDQPLADSIESSWKKIAPFWPLKNLVAVNPIAGFEHLPFDKALHQASAYFQQKKLPLEMEAVNRETIKWLQVFFDEGQGSIHMPFRESGLLKSMLQLLPLDKKITGNNKHIQSWINHLPHHPHAIIRKSLAYLDIKPKDQELFLTLMLTTLPGWASHIQYQANWSDSHSVSTLEIEYLACRLIITVALWPEAKKLLKWHHHGIRHSSVKVQHHYINSLEKKYAKSLLSSFSFSPKTGTKPVKAQLVFCIDTRSEPFRRAIESSGNYETYGFAGFFGVAVAVKHPTHKKAYRSCPVLLKPSHVISEKPHTCLNTYLNGHHRLKGFKQAYQSLKYNFSTPFSLAETVGMSTGLWMAMRVFMPKLSAKIQHAIKNHFKQNLSLSPNIDDISIEDQIQLAAKALKGMGFSTPFAPLVVFCGHGSESQNNAYATALDCGACAGQHGSPNARILAKILNNPLTRQGLISHGFNIPEDTLFLAAKHNTTTDEVTLFQDTKNTRFKEKVDALERDLTLAKEKNCLYRIQTLKKPSTIKNAVKSIATRSQDWAQVRPEWGLARNASFIIAKREFTKNIDLDGRSFLHSYDWEKDRNQQILESILTAPMIVAQWINAQYLFSTIDNIAFGGGSKVTKNITGKIGIMQGNASDLMHGLALQSVNNSDDSSYHQPIRLLVVIHAPRSYITPIISKHKLLTRLVKNNWITIACCDPLEEKKYILLNTLKWDHAINNK